MTHHSFEPAAVAALKPAINLIGELDSHAADILDLHEKAFGPGRFTRAAFRLREQGPHDQSLSFVALNQQDGRLKGSVRLTWIKSASDSAPGLLLGPLTIHPDAQNKGIGRTLVAHCVTAASTTNAQYVMLVGDQPYYGPLGFEVAPKGQVTLPGPVDENRLLVCPLGDFDPKTLSGQVRHADLL